MMLGMEVWHDVLALKENKIQHMAINIILIPSPSSIFFRVSYLLNFCCLKT